jgi:preprotein translocase subunit SecA
LKEFENSDKFKKTISNYQTLTEHNDDSEKEDRVTKATYAKMVTLSTPSFGRGTDFICRDPQVEKNGGVHVICTFFPELLSEFVQIQGRTARQGDPGSFTMILLDEDLTGYSIDVNSAEYNAIKTGDKLAYLEGKRDTKMQQQQKDDTDAVNDIKKMHKESLEFRD